MRVRLGRGGSIWLQLPTVYMVIRIKRGWVRVQLGRGGLIWSWLLTIFRIIQLRLERAAYSGGSVVVIQAALAGGVGARRDWKRMGMPRECVFWTE